MAEQNYTLKLTLGETFVIRESLARHIEWLEKQLMESPQTPGMVKEYDDAKRVAARIG